MNILVEVNIGGEENKSGICPESAWELCCAAAELPALHVGGLMTIPPVCDTTEQARGYFSKMHQLFVDMKGKKHDNINMGCLSMGMSGDFEAAILEGATMVRVGSALFGKRVYF
jgi:Predicted enzyme with a TIM-barrel fold